MNIEAKGYQLAQQDLDGGSHNPEITFSEIITMPEHHTEEERRTNYGSFGQELFVRTHHTKSGVVRKIAGISLPYPLEVKREDIIDIMKLATSCGEVEVKGWDGVQKGKIESFAVDRENGLNPSHEIKRFVSASRVILGDRFGKTPEVRTEDMNKYFNLLDTIWDFSDEVAADCDNILNNPECTYWSAFNERYFQKGIILIEGISENGVVKGMPPFSGNPVPIIDIAIDKPHQEWLENGYIAEVDSAQGDKIIADCEDTETVRDCRGLRGCSEFFDIMENGVGNFNISAAVTEIHSSTEKTFVRIVDTLGVAHFVCSACHKVKESCNCKKIPSASLIARNLPITSPCGAFLENR